MGTKFSLRKNNSHSICIISTILLYKTKLIFLVEDLLEDIVTEVQRFAQFLNDSHNSRIFKEGNLILIDEI